MATPRIVDVPCWERRWVTKAEAIGMLNISRKDFEEHIEPKCSIYMGKNYDIEQLNRAMAHKTIVKR